MSRRTHEGPMDFEYQNGTGPIDARSPFANVSANMQRFPGTPGGAKKSSCENVWRSTKPSFTDSAIPGSYSAFDSPSKSSTSLSQPHPSSPAKALPALPPAAWNSLYATPRKIANDYDDSSAGETPRSPEHQNDSDATPDTMGLRSALSKLPSASMPSLPTLARNSPTKERPPASRRDSLFGRLKDRLYSPGRGEVPRGDMTHVKEKRIKKVKSRERSKPQSRKRRYSESDSGEDESQVAERSSPRKVSARFQMPAEQQPRTTWIGALFTFIASHPTVPHILSFYAQFAFNIFLLSGCAYIIYSFWAAIQGDVDKKAFEASADIIAEISGCAREYLENRCDSPTIPPALVKMCAYWEKCMNRDPTRVARAKVSAHTFAEIFNSFVEPISYKAMIFTCLIIFGSFAISNLAFSHLREKAAAAQHFPHYGYQQPPPPTPQRHFSGQDGGFYAGTPWHQNMPTMEPAPSGGFSQIEGRGSPVRRLAYKD